MDRFVVFSHTYFSDLTSKQDLKKIELIFSSQKDAQNYIDSKSDSKVRTIEKLSVLDKENQNDKKPRSRKNIIASLKKHLKEMYEEKENAIDRCIIRNLTNEIDEVTKKLNSYGVEYYYAAPPKKVAPKPSTYIKFSYNIPEIGDSLKKPDDWDQVEDYIENVKLAVDKLTKQKPEYNKYYEYKSTLNTLHDEWQKFQSSLIKFHDCLRFHEDPIQLPK